MCTAVAMNCFRARLAAKSAPWAALSTWSSSAAVARPRALLLAHSRAGASVAWAPQRGLAASPVAHAKGKRGGGGNKGKGKGKAAPVDAAGLADGPVPCGMVPGPRP